MTTPAPRPPAAEPEALRWSMDNCTISAALDVIGDRWSLLVLREVFAGIRRFDQLTVRTAIPRQVLTDRLERLVDNGLLRKEPYREEGQRTRHEYRPTAKGLDLYPVFVALQHWGDEYLGDEDGPPLVFVHRDCGAPVQPVLRCDDGHDVTNSRDVVARLGPGARPRVVR
jgi:DNA-binding HxlR family transcriptional regulator